MASIEELLQHHRDEDDKRFDALSATLLKIDVNVESLMEYRAFQRGAMKTAAWVSGSVSTAIAFASLVIHWWKG